MPGTVPGAVHLGRLRFASQPCSLIEVRPRVSCLALRGLRCLKGKMGIIILYFLMIKWVNTEKTLRAVPGTEHAAYKY